MRYYRFENYDNKLGKSVGGFVSVIDAMFLMSLGLPANAGDGLRIFGDDFRANYYDAQETEYDAKRTRLGV